MIGMTLFHKLKGIGEIKVLSFRLHIRSIGTADVRPFVMDYSDGFKGFVYYLCCTLDKPCLVGVLYSKYEFTAL